MRYATEFTKPDGSKCFGAYGPHVNTISEASHFINERIALKSGNSTIYGNPNAFWNSERESSKNSAVRHKGWKFRVVPVPHTGKG